MKLKVRHESKFRYAGAVYANRNLLRLTPISDDTQRRLSYALVVEPKGYVSEFEDRYHNKVTLLHIAEGHAALCIQSQAVVETTLENPFGFEPPDIRLSDLQQKGNGADEFLMPSYHCFPNVAVRDYARKLGISSREKTWDAILKLSASIHENFLYKPGKTNVYTRSSDVIEAGAGVCQDFAHLMISVLRLWNVPARYVSGYLEGEGVSHAWVEAMIPGTDWRGFDPTHGLLVNDRYIRVAVGRDYQDVSPVWGYFWGAPGPSPEVHVKVEKA